MPGHRLGQRTNDEEISEVQLTLGRDHVTLIAGEVEENPDGSLRIVPMDESILVQVNGKRPGL